MSSPGPVKAVPRPKSARPLREAATAEAPEPARAYVHTAGEAQGARVNGSQAKEDRATLRELFAHPAAEELRSCIQCGTCSGSCPNANYMSFAPHQAIGMLREGIVREVLASNTPWYCSACYLCTVRCPRDIPVTSIMYLLKSLALKRGVDVADKRTSALSTTFVGEVNKRGRSHELPVLTKYYLRTNPLELIKMVPLGLRLLRRRRMPLRGTRVKDQKGYQAMLEKARTIGGGR